MNLYLIVNEKALRGDHYAFVVADETREAARSKCIIRILNVLHDCPPNPSLKSNKERIRKEWPNADCTFIGIAAATIKGIVHEHMLLE